MKTAYYFLRIWATLMAFTILSAGCSGEKEKKNEPTPDALTFELKVTDVSSTSISLTIVPSDSSATYYYASVSKEYYDQFKSDQRYLEDDTAFLQECALEMNVDLATYLSKVLTTDVTTFRFRRMTPDTEYVVYAYGMTPTGSVTTGITKLSVKTAQQQPDPMKFEISYSDVKSTSLTMAVTPSDTSAFYYCDIIDTLLYNELGRNPKAIASYTSSYFAKTAHAEGLTIAQVIHAVASHGVASYLFDRLSPKTTYYGFACAVNLAGNVISPVTVKEVATLAVQPSDITFDIQVRDVMATAVDILITPSNDEDRYFFDIQQADICDSYDSDDQLQAAIIHAHGEIMDILLWQGVYEWLPKEFEGDLALTSDTRYYVLAFGYDGGVTTGVTKVPFTTSIAAPMQRSATPQSSSVLHVDRRTKSRADAAPSNISRRIAQPQGMHVAKHTTYERVR